MTRAEITIPIELGEVLPLDRDGKPIEVPTDSATTVEVFVVCRWADGREYVTVMASSNVGYGHDVEVRLA